MNKILKNHISQTSPLILIGKIEPEIWRESCNVSKQDFLVLENPLRQSADGGTIKIEEIKELLHFVNLKPFNSKLKVAVICGAENMTTEAANALLKTLEEPPSYARIILTTLNEQKILPTILSRCTKIKLPVASLVSEPADYLSPENLAKMSVCERFNWVDKVEGTNNVFDILTLHQEYFRQKMLTGEDVIEILRQISCAKDLLETNISVKLLLENLILNYD